MLSMCKVTLQVYDYITGVVVNNAYDQPVVF